LWAAGPRPRIRVPELRRRGGAAPTGKRTVLVPGAGEAECPVYDRATLGVGASPIHPLADDRGNFNYVINQDHEFFPGGLRPGIYTVRVTDPAGASSEARFSVNGV